MKKLLVTCALPYANGPIHIGHVVELIHSFWPEPPRDSAGFWIDFDLYHSTHSPENRELSEEMYRRLATNGHIVTRDIEQAYCPNDAMFLPDRYIRGKCPNCGANDQYGDSCE